MGENAEKAKARTGKTSNNKKVTKMHQMTI